MTARLKHLQEHLGARPTQANSELQGVSDTEAQKLSASPPWPWAELESQPPLPRPDPCAYERHLCPRWLWGRASCNQI